LSAIDKIMQKYGKKQSELIPILQDIQKNKGYLPEEELSIVSKEFKVPLSRLYSLATFYKVFSLRPKGRHTINVCLGTACHVKGGAKLLDKLKRDLQINPGETSPDKRFTLEAVRCVGCCGLAPVVVIDGEFHGKLNQKKLEKVLEKESEKT
jgi:NADH-quinone oxidoreductase subunit E